MRYRDPLFDALLGQWADVEANLRGWSANCRADSAIVDGLVAKVQSTSQ